jgi:hypothetical protein
MTLLGVVLIWLAIACVAFTALSALTRVAVLGEADLGIGGDTDSIDSSYMR